MAEEYLDLSEFKEFEAEQPQEIEETQHQENFSIEYEQKEIEEVKPEVQKEEPKAEPKAEKENPESYKYFQSLADKRDAELRKEREVREQLQREIEQIKSQLNPKEEPLIPPQPPRSDDPLEEIRYARQLQEYNNKLYEQRFGKIDQYFQQVEAERQMKARQEQEANQKAFYVGQMVKAGLSPDEASQALADFSKDADNPENYFRDLAEFYRFRKGNFSDPRAKELEKRVTRQGELPPLGVIPSESESQNVDPSDAFFSDLKNSEKRYF